MISNYNKSRLVALLLAVGGGLALAIEIGWRMDKASHAPIGFLVAGVLSLLLFWRFRSKPENYQFTYDSSLVLPVLPFQAECNVHTPIHSYLRTSPVGSWEPDGTAANDAFVLNYTRDTANLRLPFELTPEEMVQMRLRVTVRPLRDQVTVGLSYKIDWTTLTLFEALKAEVHRLIHAEVAGMSRYLQEIYKLPRPLRCEGSW